MDVIIWNNTAPDGEDPTISEWPAEEGVPRPGDNVEIDEVGYLVTDVVWTVSDGWCRVLVYVQDLLVSE
jgi:hypothetical protein